MYESKNLVGVHLSLLKLKDFDVILSTVLCVTCNPTLNVQNYIEASMLLMNAQYLV